MSKGQIFPDAVLLPDGRVRIVSVDAQEWVKSNTSCFDGEIPRIILFDDPRDIIDAMDMDGLTVRTKRR